MDSDLREGEEEGGCLAGEKVGCGWGGYGGEGVGVGASRRSEKRKRGGHELLGYVS